MSAAQDKLTAISNLKDNWNGFGAKPFSVETIRFARDIADVLPIEPEIYPLNSGSILMDLWIKKRNMTLEISSLPDDVKIRIYEGSVGGYEYEIKTVHEVAKFVDTWINMKEPQEFPRMS